MRRPSLVHPPEVARVGPPAGVVGVRAERAVVRRGRKRRLLIRAIDEEAGLAAADAAVAAGDAQVVATLLLPRHRQHGARVLTNARPGLEGHPRVEAEASVPGGRDVAEGGHRAVRGDREQRGRLPSAFLHLGGTAHPHRPPVAGLCRPHNKAARPLGDRRPPS